jgi:acyl-CoA reductase-like NAD-dependent aldehyde dehydrogenase
MTPLPTPLTFAPEIDPSVRECGNPYLSDVELAQRCADHLEREHAHIVRALTSHESYEAAVGELHSSIDALRNMHRELVGLRQGAVGDISVFLPINLPLYSLILFAAVPSLMADRVDVRLPAATPDWVRAVADAMKLQEFFPRVHLNELTRRRFINEHASCADAVIFTGRYEAAEEVRAQCPEALFIFQGSGVNPVVVGPEANLSDETLDLMVTARIYNGGQDCAAPDAFLVHASRSDEFIDAIVQRADALVCGPYSDPAARVGTILNPNTLGMIEERLTALKDDTVLGGVVDRDAAYVSPTVIVRPLSEHDELMEFFAPIFYVLVYEDDLELAEFFEQREYRENAMYASLYGQRPVADLFESSTVLFNQTVLQAEQGNIAFGGNGAKSNYIAYGDDVEVGPALVTDVLARHLQRRNEEAATRTPVSSQPSQDWWIRSGILANHDIDRVATLPRLRN